MRFGFNPRVWAPGKSQVYVTVNHERCPLQETEEGWWESPISLQPGADYAFTVDQGDPMPDPRSASQPYGVHGPSRVVDHSAFQWTDHLWQPKPLASAVIYELHTGTFTPQGTFDSAIDRLDHLVCLGISHVELMPVNEFSGQWGWGYDGVGLYAPHHAYGGPDSLKRFVNACHERGLAVLLDVVYNHFGPSGNHLGKFGPYTSERHITPWGPGVNLDGPDSYEVRRFISDNAAMWMRDYHFDGLRLDAVHALVDTSATHILEDLAAETAALSRQLGRHLVLIAESDLNDPRTVNSREIGGHGIDAQWSDDFHHALHAILCSETGGYYADFGGFHPLAKAFEQVFVYNGCYSKYRRRIHGREPQTIPAQRFIVFLQNHDQIGNRAAGDRAHFLISPERARVGAALVMLSPYLPMIFQGEEWAASTPFQYFTNHPDPELAAAVTNGRRSEFASFGWGPEDVPDPQAVETFQRSKLRWDELDQPQHAEMLEWYRCLIELRRKLIPHFGEARPRVHFDEEAQWMSIALGEVTICFSLAQQPVEIAVDRPAAVVLAQTRPGVRWADRTLTLPPESCAIVGPQVW
jgi:maltooligosyltrehalose trehalohydrolase